MVTVTGIVNMTGTISVTSGYVEFTGGGTLLRGVSGFAELISISGSATVILDEVVLDGGNSELVSSGITSTKSPVGIISQPGHLVMNDGAVIKNHYGTSTNNAGKTAGGVFLDMINNDSPANTTFTMYGGMITNNYSSMTSRQSIASGAGVHASRAYVYIYGGTITNNSAAYGAAEAVYMRSADSARAFCTVEPRSGIAFDASAGSGTYNYYQLAEPTVSGTLRIGDAVADWHDHTELAATLAAFSFTPVTDLEAGGFYIDGLDEAGYPYDGTEQFPDFIVTDGETTLTVGEDYTAEYSPSINAGPVTITVTGEGAYEGELQESFTINKVPLTITVGDKEKYLGEDDPPLTSEFTGLKGTDGLTLSLGRTSGEAIGTYDITAKDAVVTGANGNATNNYAITYVKGTLTIKGPEQKEWPRLDGNKGDEGGRFDTMKAVVSEGWKQGSDTVIVSSGMNFPDALAASSLAGIYDAPVILTQTERLSSQAEEAIKELGATQAFIIGGEAAVSEETRTALAGIVGENSVSRISGENRIETALDIYEKGKTPEGGLPSWGDTAIIANGFAFADALSVSPFANVSRSPIFLSTPGDGPGSGLDEATLAALTTGGFKRVVITGGTAAVPGIVEEQLASSGVALERWWGDNRYETSADIVEQSLINSAGALRLNNIVCTTGLNYPDALAGGAFAGHVGTVLLLVHSDTSPEGQGHAGLKLISDHKDEIGMGYVLGGSAVIPQELLDILQGGSQS
ncbi:MAG: cell wall-binding repeat-containing protein [Coriobacteriales bacterium]|nr:cell wall-binding repeat-containing protein [Coriobacteriales bacterium]